MASLRSGQASRWSASSRYGRGTRGAPVWSACAHRPATAVSERSVCRPRATTCTKSPCRMGRARCAACPPSFGTWCGSSAVWTPATSSSAKFAWRRLLIRATAAHAEDAAYARRPTRRLCNHRAARQQHQGHGGHCQHPVPATDQAPEGDQHVVRSPCRAPARPAFATGLI